MPAHGTGLTDGKNTGVPQDLRIKPGYENRDKKIPAGRAFFEEQSYTGIALNESGTIPDGFLMKDGTYEDIIPHYISLSVLLASQSLV